MKMSGFFKKEGHQTSLVQGYEEIGKFDKLYLSQVFTDTCVPPKVLKLGNLTYGGTGFYYDKAPKLPDEIEHCMPDYGLYDAYIEKIRRYGESDSVYKFYTDYSIGFLTRGCFRQCSFCVNRNSTRSVPASPLEEFMDEKRKKLCFLDDNFFACPEWESILDKVMETGKRYQFRQGLDLRIMRKNHIEKLFSGKLDDTVYFAFDHSRANDLIIR